ncbi:Sulfurtransferase [Trichlorobacter ammonificans]|uniref:Sulfurtransferase n=1 Tax=Trichlorobacter ammonificans TaxID=2916410 RepID=A0ABM9D8A4_9BACT|nr:Sulfurtransferase [Trichlorobacter ammonificans]
MVRLVWYVVVACMMLWGRVLPAEAGVIGVNNEELAALLKKGVPVIDIRTEPEWRQTGIIAGSHLLTLFDEARRVVDPEGWLKKVRAVAPPDKPVILICRSGNRTAPAAKFLTDSGYATVYNVSQGIIPWIRAGLPTVPYPGP